MPRLALRRVPTTVAWGSGSTISLELSPVPFTVTGVALLQRTDITTTTATNFNDYWDRYLATLSLTGQVAGQNKTFFSFSELRLPYHMMRKHLGRFCPRRPTVVANSQTNNLQQFLTILHFGVRPFSPDGSFNALDLTAGIPPTGKGQLTLGGTFGTTNALGTNVTLNATSSNFLEVYLYGAQLLEDESELAIVPQAWPIWSMASPTPTATSTIFNTPYNVTSGNYLHTLGVMTTRGSNAPRDRQVLNSVQLYDDLASRPIIQFGGKAGTGDASGGDYEIAELLTQLGVHTPSDDASTLGVPSVAYNADAGLFFLRMNDWSTGVHPLYGADVRKITTGNLRLDTGVNNATSIAMDVMYQKYELNPLHPANAGRV